MNAKLVVFMLLSVASIGLQAGELDDIKACSAAAQTASGKTLDIASAEWEAFLFKPNEVRWPNAYCALQAGGRVFQLVIDDEPLIIDGVYGQEAKSLLDSAETRTALAIAELQRRIDALRVSLAGIQSALVEPSPDLSAVSRQLDDSIDAAFGGEGNKIVDELMATEVARAEERQREEEAARAAAQIRKQQAEADRAAAQARAVERSATVSEETQQFLWMEEGKRLVREKLKDAGSAEFQKVYFNRGSEGVPVTCGEVNAKNSFGGMTGYQKFVSAGTAEFTFLQEEVSDFADLWNGLCL